MVQRSGTSPEGQGRDAARGTHLDPPIFVHLADAYRREGLLEDAIRICREGLDAHPACASGRVLLVRALLEQGALEAARAECDRILATERDHPEALQLRASLASRQDARGPGDERKKDPLASPTLAALYAAQGHTAAAEAMYRQLGVSPGSEPEKTRRRALLERLLAFRDGARRLRTGGPG